MRSPCVHKHMDGVHLFRNTLLPAVVHLHAYVAPLYTIQVTYMHGCIGTTDLDLLKKDTQAP